MSTYRTGNHHGVTIVREGDGSRCGRPEHDCERGHLAAVVVAGGQELAERICTLLNGAEPLTTASRWRCNTTERCFREDGHDGPHGFAGTSYGTEVVTVPIQLAVDSCSCFPHGPDPGCVVHQGRKPRGPKPPYVGPGCICDGSGRRCPRHGVVL